MSPGTLCLGNRGPEFPLYHRVKGPRPIYIPENQKRKPLKTCYPEWKLVYQPSFLKSAVISFCQLHSPSDTLKSRCQFGRFSKDKVVRFNPRKCLRHKEAKLKTSCLKLWTETTVAAMCPREATSILDKMQQHHAAAFCLNSKKISTYAWNTPQTLTCLWFGNPS